MERQVPILQKLKKNQILNAIQAVGLDPREFDLAESEAEAEIEHRRSGALFTIGGSPTKYVGRYVFGDWPEWPYEAYSWEGVMQRVEVWLSDVKQDLDTPDLWAELQSETRLLGTASYEDAENTQFTTQEKEEIARRLYASAEHAERTYSLSGPQTEELKANVDYLVQASGRMGRIDWRNALVGSIFGYVMAAALPPETARAVFWVLVRGVGHVIGLPGY